MNIITFMKELLKAIPFAKGIEKTVDKTSIKR